MGTLAPTNQGRFIFSDGLIQRLSRIAAKFIDTSSLIKNPIDVQFAKDGRDLEARTTGAYEGIKTRLIDYIPEAVNGEIYEAFLGRGISDKVSAILDYVVLLEDNFSLDHAMTERLRIDILKAFIGRYFGVFGFNGWELVQPEYFKPYIKAELQLLSERPDFREKEVYIDS